MLFKEARKSKKMKSYELCVLFAGEHTSQDVDNLSKQVEKILNEHKAEVKINYNFGRRKLAYIIKGNSHGEYRLWYFSVDAKAIPEINQKLRLSNLFSRHLIVSLDETMFNKRIEKIKDIQSGKIKRNTYQEQDEKQARESEAPSSKKSSAPTTTQFQAPEPKSEKDKKEIEEKKKLSIDELDDKLDEILTDEKL